MDNNNNSENNRIMYKIWGICFVCLIVSLAVIHFVTKDKDYSYSEKSKLTTRNNIVNSIKYNDNIVDVVEEYFSDQFPGRDNVVRWKASFDRLMGKIRFQDVYICDNGYMIQDFEKPDKNNIDEMCERINGFADKYQKSNVYMMLVPNAISVYKEYLPEYVSVNDQNAFIDEVYKRLTGIQCMDIRPLFNEKRSEIQLYYYTDHHWTTDAAYIAYGLLADKMNFDRKTGLNSGIVCNNFIGTLASKSGYSPKARDSIKVYFDSENDVYYTVNYEDEQILEGTCYKTEKLSGDNPYEVFFGGNHSSIEINSSADTDRTLLVFKDSYANCVIPFLIGHYSKIKIIDPRYYSEDIDIVMKMNDYSDVLFLYNVNTFSQDTSLKMII